MKIKSGFTLIELTVVITLIGIMAILTVPSYYGATKNAKYEESITEIISLIKDMRTNAIIGKFTGTGAGYYSTPVGGYGVFVDISNQNLTFFTDTDANGTYSIGSDDVLEIYTLPNETILKSASGTKSTDYTVIDTSNNIDPAIILFKPPQAETILNENNTTKDLIELNIILERYDGLKSKTLKINKISGFIETE